MCGFLDLARSRRKVAPRGRSYDLCDCVVASLEGDLFRRGRELPPPRQAPALLPRTGEDGTDCGEFPGAAVGSIAPWLKHWSGRSRGRGCWSPACMGTIDEPARAEKPNAAYLSRVLWLTLRYRALSVLGNNRRFGDSPTDRFRS